ncbi:hypothetical protein IQ269_06560 [Tychonema sp. LEGE 07199]|nr:MULTISPECIES: hypothetical protein [unclassified Tychonema]MBE9120480.1 hypothetical protein [Tychonema sp. LEGE 07199]MBE9133189.1 hypothetical protein [Tychonema sp. LEGE 07196]
MTAGKIREKPGSLGFRLARRSQKPGFLLASGGTIAPTQENTINLL